MILKNKWKQGEKDVDLFICATWYHLLVALCKTMVSGKKADVLICMDSEPAADGICARAASVHIFQHVYRVKKHVGHRFTAANIFEKIFVEHKAEKARVESEMRIDVFRFRDIYVFMDNYIYARYLQDVRREYHLLEDCQDFFKAADNKFLREGLPSATGLCYELKRRLNIGYYYHGYSVFCKSVEVNDAKGLLIPAGKVHEYPKKELFGALSGEQGRLLMRIFEGEEIRPDEGGKSAMLITQPLYQDGFVSSMEVQHDVYGSIMRALHDDGFQVYVKPHPRDDCDYAGMCPDMVLLSRMTPTEIYNLQHLFMDKAVTINSSAIHAIGFAGEKEILGLEYLKNFEA